jgi:hypothetical protein
VQRPIVPANTLGSLTLSLSRNSNATVVAKSLHCLNRSLFCALGRYTAAAISLRHLGLHEERGHAGHNIFQPRLHSQQTLQSASFGPSIGPPISLEFICILLELLRQRKEITS